MKIGMSVLPLSLLLMTGCSHMDTRAHQVEACNRTVVLAFYQEALVNLKPRAAFDRYVTDDFIEHKPDVQEGTKAATVAFLENLIKEVPEPKWEILRSIAEGDLVFLHARFSPAAGAPHYAIADVFRLKDCKIVEHWDVVAPPPKQPLNPNSRF
jgi:predicted SnoaL-like aldol condensation-catalyzing enzyme